MDDQNARIYDKHEQESVEFDTVSPGWVVDHMRHATRYHLKDNEVVFVDGELYAIDHLAEYMDDELREHLHLALAPCDAQEFFNEYVDAGGDPEIVNNVARLTDRDLVTNYSVISTATIAWVEIMERENRLTFDNNDGAWDADAGRLACLQAGWDPASQELGARVVASAHPEYCDLQSGDIAISDGPGSDVYFLRIEEKINR